MAVPKLPKPATIRPIYTRGGSPIYDGFEPMGPGAPINTPFPTQIQNPNQVDQSAIQGGTRGAGPVRSGAFGYGVRRQSYGEYNKPITDPRRQEPGAPVTERPIVEIPGEGRGGVGAANADGRRGEANNGRQANNGRGPTVSDISRAPQSSGATGTSLRNPLAGVGVQASSVGRSTASSAGRVTVEAPKASAASSPKAATPTPSPNSTKKTGKTGNFLRR